MMKKGLTYVLLKFSNICKHFLRFNIFSQMYEEIASHIHTGFQTFRYKYFCIFFLRVNKLSTFDKKHN